MKKREDNWQALLDVCTYIATLQRRGKQMAVVTVFRVPSSSCGKGPGGVATCRCGAIVTNSVNWVDGRSLARSVGQSGNLSGGLPLMLCNYRLSMEHNDKKFGIRKCSQLPLSCCESQTTMSERLKRSILEMHACMHACMHAEGWMVCWVAGS